MTMLYQKFQTLSSFVEGDITLGPPDIASVLWVEDGNPEGIVLTNLKQAAEGSIKVAARFGGSLRLI